MSSPCQECSMYLWSIGEQNRLNYYPNKVYIINLIIHGNQTTVNRWNPFIYILSMAPFTWVIALHLW